MLSINIEMNAFTDIMITSISLTLTQIYKMMHETLTQDDNSPNTQSKLPLSLLKQAKMNLSDLLKSQNSWQFVAYMLKTWICVKGENYSESTLKI